VCGSSFGEEWTGVTRIRRECFAGKPWPKKRPTLRQKGQSRLAEIGKPRIRRSRKRLYDLPKPLNYWGRSNTDQQYFVMPSHRVCAIGGGDSSGQRETQSLWSSNPVSLIGKNVHEFCFCIGTTTCKCVFEQIPYAFVGIHFGGVGREGHQMKSGRV